MLVVLFVVLTMYYYLQRFFRRSNVELQRLDSGTRAPLQAHFSELLDGASTIQAFGMQRRFVSKIDGALDDNNRCLMAFIACNRWLGLRLDILGAFVSFSAALVCWYLRESLPPGLAGMLMIWAQVFTICLNFIIVNTTEAEAKLTSMQRVVQFFNIAQEAPLHLQERQTKAVHTDTSGSATSSTITTAGTVNCRPPLDWPHAGTLEFQDVCLRYRPGKVAAATDVAAAVTAAATATATATATAAAAAAALSLSPSPSLPPSLSPSPSLPPSPSLFISQDYHLHSVV